VPFHNLQRCAINTCSKPSLNVSNSNDSDFKNACPQCRRSFCAVHRHPSSHSCQVVDAPKSQRSASARALLAKNFPTSSRKKAAPQRTTNIPTEPIKLARHRKAELIRMRHRAAPGNPVDNSYTPQDQRLHLRLQIDEQTEKVFWFCKTTVTGKVLDCLASHVESAVSPPLRLLKVSAVQESKCVLRNDRAIVDNIEDGELLVIAGLE